MGQWVCRLLESEFATRAHLAVRVSHENTSFEQLLDTDVIIDFSSAQACCDLARAALSPPNNTSKLPAFVVGSTGWTTDETAVLDQLSKKTPVLVSANFSHGIAILTDVLKKFSSTLESLGYKAVITEAHHVHKKDAPSGTAIHLQKAIDLQDPGRIQTHSIRAGEVIGDHEVTFFGPAEQLKFSHSARDRSLFARGAIDVALWLAGQRGRPELLQHVLNMENYLDSRRT